jgi:ABC-type antimicrobial peptide transport system permease subunit
MKKLSGIRSAFHNIRQNKVYALFCIAGVALTFIFVSLVLQIAYIFAGNNPPTVYAGRTIRLTEFKDGNGNPVGGIFEGEIAPLWNDLKGYEAASLLHTEGVNILSNGRLHESSVGFVNAGFWNLNQFEFIEGAPFTREDYINRKKIAVISESISVSYFNTKNSIGEKISFQGNEYTVIGIVKEFSQLSSPSADCKIWVPYIFNKFTPSGRYFYVIDILFPPDVPMDLAKEEVAKAIRYSFEKRNIIVDCNANNIYTLKEEKIRQAGGNIFKYGMGIVIFLLLVIPAVNIVSLNMANTGNRAEEIAIRKTFGASRLSSFLHIMIENLLLTVTGAVIGVLAAKPALNLIQQNLIDKSIGNITLVTQIDYGVILAGVAPAMFIFSLLSGGLPAYIISGCNIADVLKGGSK